MNKLSPIDLPSFYRYQMDLWEFKERAELEIADILWNQKRFEQLFKYAQAVYKVTDSNSDDAVSAPFSLVFRIIFWCSLFL